MFASATSVLVTVCVSVLLSLSPGHYTLNHIEIMRWQTREAGRY